MGTRKKFRLSNNFKCLQEETVKTEKKEKDKEVDEKIEPEVNETTPEVITIIKRIGEHLYLGVNSEGKQEEYRTDELDPSAVLDFLENAIRKTPK